MSPLSSPSPADTCLDCETIRACRSEGHPLFVAELTSGFLLLHGDSGPPGRVRLVAKSHVADVMAFDPALREAFWKDLDLVSRALQAAFTPKRINVWSEPTGRCDAHAAWELLPREEDGASPAWAIVPAPPDDEAAAEVRRKILRGLLKVAPVRRQLPPPVRRRH